ncbi:MAG: hypothetical protein JWQ90_2570 [Hydrocarboniphaga sp.]|nr:hypothetical protein [Hydrocarboniphaga sp.]
MNSNEDQTLDENPAENVGDPCAYERLLGRETVPVPAYLRQHRLPDLGGEDSC